MNNTTKRLITAAGIAAAGAVTPALLFFSAGTANADSYDPSVSPFPTISDSDLGSVTAADPGGPVGGGSIPWAPLVPQQAPVPGQAAWDALPKSNSPITAIFDSLGIERGW